MRRLALEWYETRLEDIITFHNRCIQKIERAIIESISGQMHGMQHFDSFNIHLVPLSGIRFIEMNIANADDLFEMMLCEVVDLKDKAMETVVEQKKVKPNVKQGQQKVLSKVIKLNSKAVPTLSSADILERMRKLENQLKVMQEDITARKHRDNCICQNVRRTRFYVEL